MKVFETDYPPHVQNFSCFVSESLNSAETAYHLLLVSLESLRSKNFDDTNDELKIAVIRTMGLACGALETCLAHISIAEDKKSRYVVSKEILNHP